MATASDYIARLQEALDARDALAQAEAALAEGKTTLTGEELRAAKEALRAQRQAYRENHRAIVMAFEQGAKVSPENVTVTSG